MMRQIRPRSWGRIQRFLNILKTPYQSLKGLEESGDIPFLDDRILIWLGARNTPLSAKDAVRQNRLTAYQAFGLLCLTFASLYMLGILLNTGCRRCLRRLGDPVAYLKDEVHFLFVSDGIIPEFLALLIYARNVLHGSKREHYYRSARFVFTRDPHLLIIPTSYQHQVKLWKRDYTLYVLSSAAYIGQSPIFGFFFLVLSLSELNPSSPYWLNYAFTCLILHPLACLYTSLVFTKFLENLTSGMHFFTDRFTLSAAKFMSLNHQLRKQSSTSKAFHRVVPNESFWMDLNESLASCWRLTRELDGFSETISFHIFALFLAFIPGEVSSLFMSIYMNSSMVVKGISILSATIWAILFMIIFIQAAAVYHKAGFHHFKLILLFQTRLEMIRFFISISLQARRPYKALNSIACHFRPISRKQLVVKLQLASIIELIGSDRIGINALDMFVLTYHGCLIVSLRHFHPQEVFS